jgi:hypothetical protein
LLALNGLRVSEATGADIEHLGLERGHRTLTITRKGGKVVTIPLAPWTARAVDLAIGERTEGPVFLAADGRRLDRHGAGRIVRETARCARIGKSVTPARSDTPSSPPPWMPECHCGMCRRRRRTPIRAPRSGMTGPAAAWTGTRPTSSPRMSRAPPDNLPRSSSSAAGPGCGRLGSIGAGRLGQLATADRDGLCEAGMTAGWDKLGIPGTAARAVGCQAGGPCQVPDRHLAGWKDTARE